MSCFFGEDSLKVFLRLSVCLFWNTKMSGGFGVLVVILVEFATYFSMFRSEARAYITNVALRLLSSVHRVFGSCNAGVTRGASHRWPFVCQVQVCPEMKVREV